MSSAPAVNLQFSSYNFQFATGKSLDYKIARAAVGCGKKSDGELLRKRKMAKEKQSRYTGIAVDLGAESGRVMLGTISGGKL